MEAPSDGCRPLLCAPSHRAIHGSSKRRGFDPDSKTGRPATRLKVGGAATSRGRDFIYRGRRYCKAHGQHARWEAKTTLRTANTSSAGGPHEASRAWLTCRNQAATTAEKHMAGAGWMRRRDFATLAIVAVIGRRGGGARPIWNRLSGFWGPVATGRGGTAGGMCFGESGRVMSSGWATAVSKAAWEC